MSVEPAPAEETAPAHRAPIEPVASAASSGVGRDGIENAVREWLG